MYSLSSRVVALEGARSRVASSLREAINENAQYTADKVMWQSAPAEREQYKCRAANKSVDAIEPGAQFRIVSFSAGLVIPVAA